MPRPPVEMAEHVRGGEGAEPVREHLCGGGLRRAGERCEGDGQPGGGGGHCGIGGWIGHGGDGWV